MADLFIESDASISECGRYRWTLTRCWDRTIFKPLVAWIMLNPSTADAQNDDPTIRRCLDFTRRWPGFGGMTVYNLFPLRATEPADMMAAEDPIGPNCDHLYSRIQDVGPLVIAAWGVHGGHRDRDLHVARLLRRFGTALHCLGVTKEGHPKHPLYVRGDTVPVPFTIRGTSAAAS